VINLCREAVEAARRKGASYADARVVFQRTQYIGAEDRHITGVSDTETSGIGVRVIAGGAWGFAASSSLKRADVARAAARAVEVARASALARAPQGIRWAKEDRHEDAFHTPHIKDPFKVPIDEKVGLLLRANGEAMRVRGVKKCHSWLYFHRERRYLANSEGTAVTSDAVVSTGQLSATAVDRATAKTRSIEAYPMCTGYEHIDATPFVAEARRVGEEAVAKLKGKTCPTGRKDLILHPSHLALTMHESIGHATELDRVLGMEESMAGSSFATIDKLGKLKYGSKLMNIVCDNTMPFGLATRGYDDDGVKGQRWHVIRDGILVDYQSSREVCHAIGAKRSRGSCRADSWGSIPIIRQSNIGLEPGREPLSLDELIADTKDGIYIEGMGSYSIDQKRLNFQFGGDCFWEIRNGRKGAILKDVVYQAMTPEFYGSMDAICDARFWMPFGVGNCGKGDPMQVARMTHGSAPARFRKIRVGPGVK